MLYCVKGELIKLEPRMAVVMCGGVGFRLQITMNTARQMPAIGAEAMLYTEMVVREDATESAKASIRTRAAIDEIVMIEGLEADGIRVDGTDFSVKVNTCGKRILMQVVQTGYTGGNSEAVADSTGLCLTVANDTANIFACFALFCRNRAESSLRQME